MGSWERYIISCLLWTSLFFVTFLILLALPRFCHLMVIDSWVVLDSKVFHLLGSLSLWFSISSPVVDSQFNNDWPLDHNFVNLQNSFFSVYHRTTSLSFKASRYYNQMNVQAQYSHDINVFTTSLIFLVPASSLFNCKKKYTRLSFSDLPSVPWVRGIHSTSCSSSRLFASIKIPQVPHPHMWPRRIVAKYPLRASMSKHPIFMLDSLSHALIYRWQSLFKWIGSRQQFYSQQQPSSPLVLPCPSYKLVISQDFRYVRRSKIRNYGAWARPHDNLRDHKSFSSVLNVLVQARNIYIRLSFSDLPSASWTPMYTPRVP